MLSQRIEILPYLTIFVILLGVIFIPSSFVVDNFNLMRNHYFALSSLMLCAIYSVSKRPNSIEVNPLTGLALVALFLYAVRNIHEYLSIVYAITFISTLLVLSKIELNIVILSKTILILCGFETLYCYLQLFNFIGSPSVYFPITGSFENPNNYGVFVSLCIPFILFLYKNSSYRSICLIIIINTIILLILMKCKIAILCALMSIVLITPKTKIILSNRHLWVGLTIALIVACMFEYKSTLGRILILINSFTLMLKMPIFGYGSHGFTKYYMYEQSQNFEYDCMRLFSGVEGNPMHPLNEYLSYVLNVGHIGLFFIALFIYITYKQRANLHSVYFVCFLNIIILLAFNNCLSYSFVWIFSMLCLSQIKRKYQLQLDWNKLKYILIPIVTLCSVFIISDLKFEISWRRLYDKSRGNIIDEDIVKGYEALYNKWHYNPFFLYNYAVVLNAYEDFDASNQILKLYNDYINDYQANVLKADNFYQLKNYEKAIAVYKDSHKMCPSKFYPLWGLLQCYNETDKSKYLETAKTIENKEVKISSYQIQLMKLQSKKIIYEESQNIF